mmetsp:Transcript_41565/g.79603  ORF Transcript_41565/g.79603 Transcript_41565/m.79603 type:complete len:373 (-) Transcript_41565:392-1510(-)
MSHPSTVPCRPRPRRQAGPREPAWHIRSRRQRASDRLTCRLLAVIARLAKHHGSAVPRVLRDLAAAKVATSTPDAVGTSGHLRADAVAFCPAVPHPQQQPVEATTPRVVVGKGRDAWQNQGGRSTGDIAAGVAHAAPSAATCSAIPTAQPSECPWHNPRIPPSIRRPSQVCEDDMEDQLVEHLPAMTFEALSPRRQKEYEKISVAEISAYVCWKRAQDPSRPRSRQQYHEAWDLISDDTKCDYLPDDPLAALDKDGKWQDLLQYHSRFDKEKQSTSPGGSAAEDGQVRIGDYVEVHSLQGAKELNGRRGRIVAFVDETSRYGVRLDGDDDTKAVRPANLSSSRRLQGLVACRCGQHPVAWIVLHLKANSRTV